MSLRIYDVRGGLVKDLSNQYSPILNRITAHWNGKTDHGIDAVNGVYFVVLQTHKARFARKIMLLR